MHWFTDVAVGMVTGVTIGVGMPLLLNRRKAGSELSLRPTGGDGQVGMQLSGRW